jgi:hypothetical protein
LSVRSHAAIEVDGSNLREVPSIFSLDFLVGARSYRFGSIQEDGKTEIAKKQIQEKESGLV